MCAVLASTSLWRNIENKSDTEHLEGLRRTPNSVNHASEDPAATLRSHCRNMNMEDMSDMNDMNDINDMTFSKSIQVLKINAKT